MLDKEIIIHVRLFTIESHKKVIRYDKGKYKKIVVIGKSNDLKELNQRELYGECMSNTFTHSLIIIKLISSY